jgi:type I restriction enzyme, S subunit
MMSEKKIKYIIETHMSGAWGDEPVEGNSVVCLRAADIETERLTHKTDDLTRRSFKKEEFRNKQLKPGDIILEKSGGGENQPVGRVILFSLDEPALCSNFLEVLRPKKSFLLPQFGIYLLYSIWSSRKVVLMIKQTTGIQNLDISDYLDTKVVIPEIQQQRKIAKYLNKETSRIDAMILAKEKLLKFLEEKKQALITKAVTKGLNPNVKMKESGIAWLGEVPENWNVCRLKHVSTKIGSGVTPKGGAAVYQKEGIPLLRSQNIHFDGLRLEDVAYISEETHESMSGSKVVKGDILLNITGGSIGRCFYFDGEYSEANVNQHVCIIRPNKLALTKYLYFFFVSSLGQNQVELYQEGGGREGLTFENIKSFVVPLPSVNEQEYIIRTLQERIGKLSLVIQKSEYSLQLLKEKRSALISSTVTGKNSKLYEN